MPLKFACEAEGVPWPTMEGWIRRGKAAAESDEKVKPIDALYVEAFHAFRTSVARAVKKLTISALAGGKGARQSMWLLERRFPKDYGTHQQIELSGKDGGPVATVALSAKLDELSVEDLRRLARGE